ncbi:MAG: hypothetical protein Greene041619_971 [Candidatus Peregrinibacteria bacterium Greene0416_19]|nr:MAG: hypothetical protein Greene041619_971 [Candidatus Peregrinibacteria bacterium Greene0416_19]
MVIVIPDWMEWGRGSWYRLAPHPPLSMCGCSPGMCSACKTIGSLVLLVLTLAAVAALIGVVHTHYVLGSWVFGSMDGSVALITLIVSLLAGYKLMKKMCGCGCCGSLCTKCGHDDGCTCGKNGKK